MTFRDLTRLAASNLWRQKLRVVLTLLGVAIAITTFVTMLAFTTGMKRNLEQQALRFGLFHRVQVYPGKPADPDSAGRELTEELLGRMQGWPQVRLAYPLEGFQATVETSSDSSFTSQAQALPRAALGEGRFLSLAAGRFVSSDSAREAVVSETLLDSLGAAVPKAALDQSLVLTTRSASVDSGLAAMVEGLGSMGDVMGRVRLDSLEEPGYRRRALRREMGQSLGDFLEGYQQRPAEHRDTLRVVGVLEREGAFAGILPPLLVPPAVAGRLSRGGDPSDPSALLAAMQEGTLFELGDEALEGSYRKITLELHDPVQHAAVLDSLEELGLRSFSFAAQFKDISRAFALMNLGMGLIGFIALFVAALGIVNTLVMAIVERRREIGVLKALGASEGEIRAVFLAESGAIGLLGGLLGIAAGWVVIRVGVAVGTAWLESMGEVGMAGFTFGLTPTLTALALLFGVGVSLAAGLYPAARAARLDPVAALRAE